jgi:hypothetical protein
MRHQARLEPCVTCKNPECGTTVILRSLASERIELDDEADFLRVTCPSCGLLFSTSIFKLGWTEVEIYASHEYDEDQDELVFDPVVDALFHDIHVTRCAA